jgi:hypothetical protein
MGIERLKTFAPSMTKVFKLLTAHEEIGDERKRRAPIARECNSEKS